MPSGIYSGYNPYGSKLARKKKRRFFVRLFIILLAILISLAVLAYLLFFSSALTITKTAVNGLKTVDQNEIISIINSAKDQRFLGKFDFKPGQNILFFNSNHLRSRILAEFKVIKRVEVIKKLPHEITVNIEERLPIGTWCLTDSLTLLTTSCRYFDDSGTLWGKALRSSGSLLLNIDDLRVSSDSDDKIEPLILESVKKTAGGLDDIGIRIKRIEILTDSIGDFRIDTVFGYYILFNEESDILGQLKTLKILIDEKGSHFKPEYIDLRIEGRIYYK